MRTGIKEVKGTLKGGNYTLVASKYIGDPDGYTKLLTHFDGQNAGTAIVDSGDSGYVVTQVGTASLSTAFRKIGGGSCFFDGNSDWLTVPDSTDWYFGTMDFTLDLWVRFNSVSQSVQTLIAQFVDGSNFWELDYNFGGASEDKLTFYAYSGGELGHFVTTSTMGLLVNTWYHIALVRSGSTCYMFLNGTSLAVTQTQPFGTMPDLAATLRVGSNGGTQYSSTYIDELRISNTARWTQNFTPQTTPYTSDSYTKLLLHMEPHDVCGNIPTFNSTAKLSSNPIKKFGAGSLLLDGNSDYVTYPDSADWAWGTGAFTVDFWYKCGGSVGGYIAFFNQGESNVKYSALYWTGNTLRYQCYNNANVIYVSWSITEAVLIGSATGTWKHLAIVRDGTGADYSLKCYIDGVSLGNGTLTGGAWNAALIDWAGVFEVGGMQANSFYFNGYIDEFRIVKGTAKWTANFTPSTTAYTGSDIPTNGLLLHLDYDYLDSSIAAHGAGTGVGTAQVTTISRIGAGSLLLDGNSDYVTYPDSADWNLGNTFTVDTWIKVNGATGDLQQICGQFPNNQNATVLLQVYPEGNVIYAGFYVASAWTLRFSAPYTPRYGVWQHIALVRVDGGNADTSWRIFLDGVQLALTKTLGNWNAAFPVLTASMYVGMSQNAYYFNGYIDELRISKDTARWTAGFTPQTTAYTADTYTKLLCHFDYDYMDSSTVGNPTGTGYGAVATSAVQSKFGGGSLLLISANSQYVTYPDSSNWAFGSGDFTIDCWVRFVSTTGIQFLAGQSDGTNFWYFRKGVASDNKIMFYASGPSGEFSTTTAPTLATDTWYHFAIVRSGASCYIFVNGVSQALTQTTAWGNLPNSTGVLNIGAWYDATYFLSGYIDELRVSKGVARWTSNFTPSIAAYTTDWHTKLLCHFDTDFSDASGISHGVGTGVGTAQVTSPSRFGTTALLLNGSSDYVSFPTSTGWAMGPGDFTVDFWLKFNSVATHQFFFGENAGNGFDAFWHTSNIIQVLLNGVSYNFAWTPVIGIWYHIAVTRSGTNLRAFINGVQIGTTQISNDNIPADLLYIGRQGPSLPYYLNGYIDEFRISKGIARWTYDFQPPTAPYDLTVEPPATQLDFAGLNGNVDEEYKILCKFVSGAASITCSLRLNNDAATNYGSQLLSGNNTVLSAPRATSTGLKLASVGNAEHLALSDISLYARSGYARTSISSVQGDISGTVVTNTDLWGQSWNNLIDNITIMSVLSDVALGLGNGSSIEIYAKRESVQ